MNTEKFERKLTATLRADVQGYSRLMRDDEDETVRIHSHLENLRYMDLLAKKRFSLERQINLAPN